jgi:hypothetical protein
VRVLGAPNPGQHLAFSVFSILAILVSSVVIIVVICIYWITDEVKHLLICLLIICTSSFMKCLFMFLEGE